MSKEDQIRALREARFQRWMSPVEARAAVVEGLRDKIAHLEKARAKKVRTGKVGRPSLGKPWEKEGVSRSTYFSRKKR